MSGIVAALFGLAAVAAVVNWVGVVREDRRLVWMGKPATLVLLIAAALALTPEDPTVRAWFVVALVLSLAGDVFLMLPDDRPYPVDPFLCGLASFLLGHLAYIVGMVLDHRSWVTTAVGVVVVVSALAVVAPRILAGVGSEAPAMRGPVLAYMSVISVMVVAAFGRRVPAGIVGAMFFYASDSILAWNRFVRPSATLRLLVMVTYHLAQAFLVISLLD